MRLSRRIDEAEARAALLEFDPAGFVIRHPLTEEAPERAAVIRVARVDQLRFSSGCGGNVTTAAVFAGITAWYDAA